MGELNDDAPVIDPDAFHDLSVFDAGWTFLIRRAMENNRRAAEQSQQAG